MHQDFFRPRAETTENPGADPRQESFHFPFSCVCCSGHSKTIQPQDCPSFLSAESLNHIMTKTTSKRWKLLRSPFSVPSRNCFYSTLISGTKRGPWHHVELVLTLSGRPELVSSSTFILDSSERLIEDKIKQETLVSLWDLICGPLRCCVIVWTGPIVRLQPNTNQTCGTEWRMEGSWTAAESGESWALRLRQCCKM